jgi:hypothetical protein
VTDNLDSRQIEEPLSGLERELISTYLSRAGFDYHALLARGDDEARLLLAKAASYASERLGEIEARSLYVHELHGDK